MDYDGLGNIDWIIDRNSRRRDFDYDINDNLTREIWGDGTQLTFDYDKVGNLQSDYDSQSGVVNSYSYDGINQLTSAVTGGVEFKYDYDRYGNIIKREDLVKLMENGEWRMENWVVRMGI
jgi:YD repeat-containing protein